MNAPRCVLVFPDSRRISAVLHSGNGRGTATFDLCETRLLMCQTFGHQCHHRNVNHRFSRGRQAFVVFAQPAIAFEPAKGALHNPTMGQHFEPFCRVTAFHNVENPATQLTQSTNAPALTTTRPDFLKTRKPGFDLFQ